MAEPFNEAEWIARVKQAKASEELRALLYEVPVAERPMLDPNDPLDAIAIAFEERAMTVTVSQIAAELADREAIRDCLARYCRGMDRADAEMIRSAYWPGAVEHYAGSSRTIEEFIEWALPQLAQMDQAMHLIGNVLARIDGERARVETYFWSVAVVPGENPTQTVIVGRYLDKFEKRGDEWRIAERNVAHDWFEEGPATGDWAAGPFGIAGLLRGGPVAEDPSRTWLGL